MQKKIISLAVAALASGAAFAQSNVTIYGIMDVGVSSYSADSVKNYDGKGNNLKSARNTGVYSDGYTSSRLGFKGEEALGNGLKAVFQLESAISQDDKDARWGSTRQAFVGLTSSSFGTVKLGTQSSLSDSWHGGAGAENMGNLSTRNIIGGVKGSFANTKQPGITYVSPSFSGLTVGAGAYFIDEGGEKSTVKYNGKIKNSDDRQTVYQIGANYANGPITAAVTFAALDRDFGKSSKEYTVSGGYDFGVAKLTAGYEATKDIYMDGTASAYEGKAGLYDFATWSLGLSVPVMANGKVHLGYSQTDNDGKKNDSEAWMLGYEHTLSKRTTVYAAYQYLDNDKRAVATPAGRYANKYGKGEFQQNVADRDFDGFSIGLRHSF